jgi:hypothetical protein
MATNTDLLLISAFTGGVNMPTSEQAEDNYVARAYLDADGKVNIEYVAASTAYAADAAVAASLAPMLRGMGLTVDSANALRPRPRMRLVQMRDQFITGNTTSGSIGQLGWNLLGAGTPVATRSSITTTIGNSEKLVLETSASINDRSTLCLGDTETRAVVVPSEVKILQSLCRLPVLSDRRFFFGLASNFATNAASAVNALGIYYDSAVSPNWQIIARSSSAGSPTVTSSALVAGTAELLTMYQPTAGTFQFYSGNTLIGSISSGVPTAPLNVGWRVETLAAAAKSAHIGGFFMHAECDAATNASDDDTFLEA